MSLTAKEKSKAIYRLVKTHLDHSIREDIDAQAKLAMAKEGHRLWMADESHAMDRSSPYNVNNAQTVATRTAKVRAEWSEVLDHAVEVFIDKEV